MTPGEDGEIQPVPVYPKGYSVLAKLQFSSKPGAHKNRRLTAFTYIANPDMAKHMRISLFTRAYNGPSKEESSAVFIKECF